VTADPWSSAGRVRAPDGTVVELASVRWVDVRWVQRSAAIGAGAVGVLLVIVGLLVGGWVWPAVLGAAGAGALGALDGHLWARRIRRWTNERIPVSIVFTPAGRRRSAIRSAVVLGLVLIGVALALRSMLGTSDDAIVGAIYVGMGTLATVHAVLHDRVVARALRPFERDTGYRLGRLARDGNRFRPLVGATCWHARVEVSSPRGPVILCPTVPKADGTPWTEAELPAALRAQFLGDVGTPTGGA